MEPRELHPLVYEAIRDPLLVVSLDGAVAVANGAARAFLGVHTAGSIDDAQCQDENIVFDAAAIRDLMVRYESVRNHRLYDASGQPSHVSVDIEPILTPGGNDLRLLHVRNQSSAVRRETWKDDVISLVSHEIKNPLAAIKNSVDILLSQVPGPLTDGQKKFLNTSSRSIERLAHLVEGFLDVSRIHSGAFSMERGTIDVREFLAEVTRSFRTQFNVDRVSLDWEVDADVTDTWMDPAKMEQVLINLLTNSLKFTPEGGNIFVHAARAGVEALHDDLRILPWEDIGRPRLLRLTVADTGLGMSSETLDNVFERYHRQNEAAAPGMPTGTHLGLSISRKLVEAQAGIIEIESEIGIGTRVAVCVPMDRATATILTRARQLRDTVAEFGRARRSVTLYVLGKFSDDDWSDIAATWKSTPTLNPASRERIENRFALWALSGEVAVALCFDPTERETVDQLFSGRFVTCDDDAYVFSSYAIGAGTMAPGSAATFAQLVGLATARMARARDIMARASIESLDSGIECLISEWGGDSEPFSGV